MCSDVGIPQPYYWPAGLAESANFSLLIGPDQLRQRTTAG
jgi:hypothetical protein